MDVRKKSDPHGLSLRKSAGCCELKGSVGKLITTAPGRNRSCASTHTALKKDVNLRIIADSLIDCSERFTAQQEVRLKEEHDRPMERRPQVDEAEVAFPK